MNTQESYYTTGLAGHIPLHVVRRGTSETFAQYDDIEPIEEGPFHPLAIPPAYQTQQELIARLITMNAELSDYIEVIRKQRTPWADYQSKAVARCCDLMELEHAFCTPATVAFLEEHHGINPTAEDGEVTGQYAEFALLPAGHGIR